MEHERFEQMYQGQAPWDTGRPQPAIIKLAEAGQIRGSVLDVGCGTGENVLYLAAQRPRSLGYRLRACCHRAGQGQSCGAKNQRPFSRGERLGAWQARQAVRHGDRLWAVPHVLDEERSIFVRSLSAVLRAGGSLYLLCFSDEQPGTEGPRRITQQEIRDSFHEGWNVKQIEPIHFEAIPRPDGLKFGPAGPKAWLATIERQ